MGIYGNKQADKLANLSLTQPQHCNLILTQEDAVRQISTQLREQWHIAWPVSSSKLRKYKTNISALLPTKLTRRDSIALTRLQLETSKLTQEHLFKKTMPPVCSTSESHINTS